MPADLKVLWATDGSDCALAAVPLIRSLVLPVAASVHVLTVAPEPLLSGARPDPIYLKPMSASERKAALGRALGVAQSSMAALGDTTSTVESQSRFGHPIQEILRAAEAIEADLIVLGAKGRSNLRLMLLGSVAQGVLQYARRPVLLVRRGSVGVSTAVVGVDGSAEALNALRFLLGLALEKDATLVLTRAIQLIPLRRSIVGSDGDAFAIEVSRLNSEALREAHGDLASARDALAGSGFNFVEAMPKGRAGEQVVRTAAAHKAELVVGSRPPSRARKYLIGSTAELVARAAAASVLVVR
jgi:nucleotide-binding universal stress UspA family protein